MREGLPDSKRAGSRGNEITKVAKRSTTAIATAAVVPTFPAVSKYGTVSTAGRSVTNRKALIRIPDGRQHSPRGHGLAFCGNRAFLIRRTDEYRTVRKGLLVSIIISSQYIILKNNKNKVCDYLSRVYR